MRQVREELRMQQFLQVLQVPLVPPVPQVVRKLGQRVAPPPRAAAGAGPAPGTGARLAAVLLLQQLLLRDQH